MEGKQPQHLSTDAAQDLSGVESSKSGPRRLSRFHGHFYCGRYHPSLPRDVPGY